MSSKLVSPLRRILFLQKYRCLPSANRHVCIRRSTYCTLSPPHVEGTEKQYPSKIRDIVTDISQLTLIEVADLNELLKKTLNIQDAPMMAMASAPSQAKEEEDEAPAAITQTSFTVKLMAFSADKKIALIKEIKSQVDGMNLVQAKKFVESAPQPVKSDISKEEAESLAKALEAAGGTIEIE